MSDENPSSSSDTIDAKPAEPKDAVRTFTQEQVNALLADQKRKVQGQYQDYGDLKAKAQAHDKAIEAARTDQEKAVEAAKNEGRTEARTEANVRLVSAEARALAAEAKFRNPILAVRALDLSGVKVNDDGSVDAAAIKTALKELSDAEPYLLDDGKGGRPRPDNGQGRTGGDSKPSVARGRELYAERNKKTSA